MTKKTENLNPEAFEDTFSIIGNLLVHMMHYYDQGYIKDYKADFIKYTDYFIFEHPVEVGKIDTHEKIEVLKSFDANKLETINSDKRFSLFINDSIKYLSNVISEFLYENRRVEIKRHKKYRINLEEITSGMKYQGNNDSNYKDAPSAYSLTMY